MVKHLLTTTAVTLALASAGLAQQATPTAPAQTREQLARAQQQEPGPVVIQGEHGQTQTSAPEAQGQQGQPGATTSSGTEVTGLVTAVDEQAHELVINGQTYIMPEESGTAMLPAEGDEVTLFYREEGGRRVITRIGQPRQR